MWNDQEVPPTPTNLRVWVRVRVWDICNSGTGRNDQEFLHFLVIPDVHKFRNSALHLFKLCKWSVSHPWYIFNSGIGRNDQEFLHFLVIPDMHKFQNSALLWNRSFKMIISLFSISFEFGNYPEWPGIGCWELDLKGTTNQEFLVVACIWEKGPFQVFRNWW